MRAVPIRGNEHPAEEDVAEVDVEAAANADQTKERSVHVGKFDRLNHSFRSVICNRKQVAKVSCSLLAVNIAHKKTLEESIRVI